MLKTHEALVELIPKMQSIYVVNVLRSRLRIAGVSDRKHGDQPWFGRNGPGIGIPTRQP